MPKKYSGAYTKGSAAGKGTNLRGAEAETLLEPALNDLGYKLGETYFKQVRVPYLSNEKYRKISAAYGLIDTPKNKATFSNDAFSEALTKLLWGIGGPNIKEDFVIGSSSGTNANINTIISVTQADPRKPGHSIENKLHQALGELYLHKIHNQECRSILFIGGAESGWATKSQLREYGSPYVLHVLKLFYDDVVLAWDDNPQERIKNAISCSLRNTAFWAAEKLIADSIKLDTDRSSIPSENLRAEFIENVLFPIAYSGVRVHSDIKNSVARFMAECSLNAEGQAKGVFFAKLANNDRVGIETDRGFNNAPEAAINILLNNAKLSYTSEMKHGKQAVMIKNNLLYQLGFKNMHRYTDFILKGKDGLPVYIESKSAGGGFEGGHKHITDRAREQIARSLLHRTTLDNGNIKSNPQRYHWIFVLDADWCTPDIYPHKFIHVLQLAGAERWFSARKLLTANYAPDHNCAFINYIRQLCK